MKAGGKKWRVVKNDGYFRGRILSYGVEVVVKCYGHDFRTIRGIHHFFGDIFSGYESYKGNLGRRITDMMERFLEVAMVG